MNPMPPRSSPARRAPAAAAAATLGRFLAGCSSILLGLVVVWGGLVGPASQAGQAAPAHRPDGRWVTDWLVLDRYLDSQEQAGFLQGMTNGVNPLPRAGEVAGEVPGLGRWKQVSMRGDLFDIRGTLGRDFPGKTAFLYCELVTETAGDIELRLSCRPEARLWLNGRPLDRGDYLYDEEFRRKGTWIFEIPTRPGTNTLLLAVSQLGLDPGFALRILPPERSVLRGRVLDAAGEPIPRQVRVAAWRGGREVTAVWTENGIYRLSLIPDPAARYDIAFTHVEEGTWWLGEKLGSGQRRQRDAQLRSAVSLSGAITMLDKAKSPHRQVLVQALQAGQVTASTTSDGKGYYQFVNLRPGDYQLRCLTPGRRRYYRAGNPDPQTLSVSGPDEIDASPLTVVEGQTRHDLDFRFPGFKRGVWKRYETFDGLPSNRLRGLVATSTGEMWVPTDAGLARFDGSQWSTVPGTEGRQVVAVVVAPDATVWYGTYAGLFHLAGGRTESYGTNHGLPDEAITALAYTRQGELWVGTSYGLSRLEGARFRTFTVADGLGQIQIHALAPAPDGSLWVGTGRGLFRYDGRSFTNFTREDGLPDNEVSAIEASVSPAVLVATSGGVAEFRDGHFVPLISAPSYPLHPVKTLARLPDGQIWMGTGNGLTLIDGEGVGYMTVEDGLGGANVAAIHHAEGGYTWFATENGLARLDRDFANYTTRDGLPDDRVFDVRQTSTGLWVGTEWGGVGLKVGDAFVTVLPGFYARRLHQAADGQFWVGTDKGALPLQGPRPQPEALLTNRWVMAIDTDARGDFWLGDGWSGGGLVHLLRNPDGGQSMETFTRAQGLAHDQVNVILCQTNGVTWIGTARGLSRYDGKTFHNYTEEDGLPNSTVRALTADPGGAGIWIGTDGGIAFFDGSTLENMTRKHGLPICRIWCIDRSKDGFLWFGTDARGLLLFDGVAFSSFDTRDGLADNSVTSIDEDDTGRVWLGTSRAGITAFRRKTTAPNIHLGHFKVGGVEWEPSSGPLRVKVREPVSFAYKSTDWSTAPGKNQYRLVLRRGAAEAGAGGVEVFRRVTPHPEFDWAPEQPGSYQLEVQAIGQNLCYSEPARAEFTVFVPWYEQSRWRILVGTGMLGVLGTGIGLAWANFTHRREAQRIRNLLAEQEYAARVAMEEKNRQLEIGTVELQENQRKLEDALANVKTLRGLVPICAACKKIRDDRGFWEQLETYVQRHSTAKFSHGLCPECIKKWYPTRPSPDTPPLP